MKKWKRRAGWSPYFNYFMLLNVNTWNKNSCKGKGKRAILLKSYRGEFLHYMGTVFWTKINSKNGTQPWLIFIFFYFLFKKLASTGSVRGALINSPERFAGNTCPAHTTRALDYIRGTKFGVPVSKHGSNGSTHSLHPFTSQPHIIPPHKGAETVRRFKKKTKKNCDQTLLYSELNQPRPPRKCSGVRTGPNDPHSTQNWHYCLVCLLPPFLEWRGLYW